MIKRVNDEMKDLPETKKKLLLRRLVIYHIIYLISLNSYFIEEIYQFLNIPTFHEYKFTKWIFSEENNGMNISNCHSTNNIKHTPNYTEDIQFNTIQYIERLRLKTPQNVSLRQNTTYKF